MQTLSILRYYKGKLKRGVEKKPSARQALNQ